MPLKRVIFSVTLCLLFSLLESANTFVPCLCLCLPSALCPVPVLYPSPRGGAPTSLPFLLCGRACHRPCCCPVGPVSWSWWFPPCHLNPRFCCCNLPRFPERGPGGLSKAGHLLAGLLAGRDLPGFHTKCVAPCQATCLAGPHACLATGGLGVEAQHSSELQGQLFLWYTFMAEKHEHLTPCPS